MHLTCNSQQYNVASQTLMCTYTRQGLVAGPFGMLVGGWLGKGAGLSRAAEDKELERIGMTRESAKMMQQVTRVCMSVYTPVCACLPPRI